MLLGKAHAEFRGGYDLTASSRLWWVVAYSGLVAIVGYGLGLPESPSLRTPLRTSVVASAVPPVLVAVVQTAIGGFVLPRFFLLLSIPANILILFAASLASGRLSKISAARERVLLLCDEEEAAVVRSDVEYHAEIPCSIVGQIALSGPLVPEDLLERSAQLEPTLVVYSSGAAQRGRLVPALTALHGSGVRIRDLSAFYDAFIGKVPIRELESTALLFDVREIHHPSYLRISRIVDVSFAVAGGLILGLVIPFVLAGNAIANRGPLFYSQDRVGKGSTPLRILKFRSMSPGGTTSQWTAQDDPRITRFGRILRLTHLDELPQVLNILKGDLSLVGPRPEQPHYVAELSAKIPFYSARHLVRPGLTGWAQVNYPYGADEIDAFEKLQYEFWYLRHQRIFLDLKIIARTVRHVLGFGGR